MSSRPIPTLVTWVGTFLADPDNRRLGGSGSWKKGRIARVSSFLGSGGKDTDRRQNPSTLGGLKTMGFPTLIALPGLR